MLTKYIPVKKNTKKYLKKVYFMYQAVYGLNHAIIPTDAIIMYIKFGMNQIFLKLRNLATRPP
jgi:hypothetical protein